MLSKKEAREKAEKYIESLKKNGELKVLSGEGIEDEPVGLLSGGDEDDLELLRDIKQSDYSKRIKDKNDR
ncbi:MAG: hypothetical protein JKY50_15880 [Oleispira sp.]|nr:hypothetical protein [Oleispira sp.]MBL4881903.1 hypothetical protein [Oleispira sp.]